MFKIARYTPMSPMRRMEDIMEGFFRESLPWAAALDGPAKRLPAIDIIDSDDHVLVKAEVPGYRKEDLQISVEQGVLTLRGERKGEKEEKTEDYFYREISSGSFARSVRLPDNMNEEFTRASLKEGILYIEVPKKEAAEPQKKLVEISE